MVHDRKTHFTVALGDDWDILAKMHVRIPLPWLRMGLKAEEIGVLAWLLSHKPGQPISARFAAKALSCGEERIKRICVSLETRDILRRHRVRDDKGRLTNAVWELVPPPAFRDLARALDTIDDPEPQNDALDSTSENTHPDGVKPQVKPKALKTYVGKSRPKAVTSKRHTHTGHESSPATGGDEGGVCVSSDDGKPSTGDSQAEKVTAKIIDTIALEPQKLISTRDKSLVRSAVAACLRRGHAESVIIRRVDGCTNSLTVAPRSVLVGRLRELESEDPAVLVPQVAKTVQERLRERARERAEAKCPVCHRLHRDDYRGPKNVCRDCESSGQHNWI